MSWNHEPIELLVHYTTDGYVTQSILAYRYYCYYDYTSCHARLESTICVRIIWYEGKRNVPDPVCPEVRANCKTSMSHAWSSSAARMTFERRKRRFYSFFSFFFFLFCSHCIRYTCIYTRPRPQIKGTEKYVKCI